MVSSDLRTHQEKVRAAYTAADDASATPIFQGEYLLVRMATGAAALTLHRVGNGLFMSDAKLPDVTFTST
eukprot:5712668-Pleurochrysis_carterae.AAC.1